MFIIKIQARNSVIRLRLCRFFFNRNGFALFIEFNDAEPFRIIDIIAKYRSPFRISCSLLQMTGQPSTVENIIAQNHSTRFPGNEFFTENKGLSQSIWRRLHLITQMDTITGPISQEPFKIRQIRRRRNNQNIPNPSQHQRRQRIINHGLIIHRQQLLRRHHRQRIQPRPTTPS